MPKQVNVPTRRERIAEVTREDLSGAARALLIEGGGPEAVTVRAVAARAGMTAPAIYRYFTNRGALLARVISDILWELASHLEETGSDGELPARERLVRTSRAFRLWALDHRTEFGLLFGTPHRDVEAPVESPGGQGFDRVWLRMFASLSCECAPRPWPVEIGPEEREWVRTFQAEAGDGADPALAMRFLYAWQEICGSICAEVFGHLHWALDDAGPLFEARLLEVLDYLGLPRGEEAGTGRRPGAPAPRPGSGAPAPGQAPGISVRQRPPS